MKPSLTLLIPVFNDGDRVIPVITTLFHTVNHELIIIAIYDSEDDPTYSTLLRLAKIYPNLRVVKNHWKNGGLNAIKTGLEETQSEYVGIWVSYHIDPMGKINDMLELMDQGYDMVSADRFDANAPHSRGGVIKKLVSRIGNSVVSNMLSIPVNDLSTSIKIFRKSCLEKIETETTAGFGWSVIVEWTIKMALQGNKIGQVAFGQENLNFLHSDSNFKLTKQVTAYFKWLQFGFKNRKIIRSNYS